MLPEAITDLFASGWQINSMQLFSLLKKNVNEFHVVCDYPIFISLETQHLKTGRKSMHKFLTKDYY